MDRKHRTGPGKHCESSISMVHLTVHNRFPLLLLMYSIFKTQTRWNSLYWDTYGISETLRQWDNLFMNIMNHIVNFIPKKILLIVPDWWWRNLNNVLIIYLSHEKKALKYNIYVKYFQHYLLYRYNPKFVYRTGRM